MTEYEISVLLEAVSEMIEASQNAVLDAVVAKLAEIENRVTDQIRAISEFKAQVLADRDHDERQRHPKIGTSVPFQQVLERIVAQRQKAGN